MHKVAWSPTEAEDEAIPLLRSWRYDNWVFLENGPNGVAYYLTEAQTESLLELLYQQVSQIEDMIDRIIQMQSKSRELVIA